MYVSEATNKIILDKEPEDFYYEPENDSIKKRDTDMVFDWTKEGDKYYIIAKAYTGKDSQKFTKADA